MRRARGPAVALAAAAMTLAVWFVGSAGPARACSCMDATEAEHDAVAETIIIGRPTAVTEHPDTNEVEYTVDVELLEKGEITQPVSLFTAQDGAACGASLHVGQLYKLYPRRGDDGRYRIDLCDGNRPATDADLQPPEPEEPDEPPSTTTSTTAAATTSTTRPAATITTVPPPTLLRPSTTSTSSPAGEAAVSIDDSDDDDSGGAGFLRTVGTVGVAGVGGAAIAVWYQRRRLR